jgi:ABC-2 type transport system permease protein
MSDARVLHPDLREVSGPSALGGGRRRSLELLYLLAVNDFRRTYVNTWLGYVWTLVRPLMLFGVLLAVFTQIFRIGSEVPDYAVLLLFNIVLFSFFQEATTTAVGSIVGQESVMRKTQFPRLVVPLSVVLTSLFNLALNLVVVFVFILAWGIDPRWSWLGLGLVLLVLGALTTAIAMIVASLFPRFRDLGIIWGVLATVLFYGTPVLYPLEAAPGTLRDVLLLNPLTPLFELARVWVIDPTAPGPVDAAGGVAGLLPAILIGAGTCALAVWVFRREAPRIAEAL